MNKRAWYQLPVQVILIPVIFILLCYTAAAQQDSLHLTLPEAESIFLQKNLSLLAQEYNIDIAKAQIIQAKLYNNPNFQFTGNIYNREKKKPFDLSNKTGEYIAGVQQLILLAGKRNKQIKLAETNTVLQQNRFFDLLRTLRFSLRSVFYQQFFLQNSINAYNKQIAYLEKLNAAYQQLLARGIVTLKDAVRIKSLLYSLKAEQTTLQNQVSDLNAQLQLLIQNNAVYIVPVADTSMISSDLRQYPLQSLLDSAYANRFDLKLAQNNVIYNQQNYVLQKALATPDLTAGAQFDKRGSFVENASFFTLAMDLPFFNKNQGNIKAAKISIDQSKNQLQLQQQTVVNEVQRAYVKALNTDKMLSTFDPAFRSQLQKLLQGVTENFQKKNISLLEFTDFYESYKQNILQFNQLQNDRMQAIEALQFAIGKTLFN
ncbi:MAG: TolC family protein [Bacteroidota bacterium]|nr:TolC family protein [Bacteroidota bacterium]